MQIPIKQILLEVSLEQLENSYRKGIINRGKLIRRKYGKIYGNSIDSAVTQNKIPNNILQNTKNLIQTYTTDPIKLEKRLKEIDKKKNQFTGIYHSGQSLKKDELPIDVDRGNFHRAMNALTNNHEQNEYRLGSSKNRFDRSTTVQGNENGHQSLSRIIGIERNNIINGDHHLKTAGKKLTEIRNQRGEIDIFNNLLPKNNVGETFIKDYNDPVRLNRRFLKEMHKKEANLMNINNINKELKNREQNSFA